MDGRLAVTWWGHAAATVELGAARIALDPLLSRHLYHLRRFTPPPSQAAYEADLVLVSHLHHDHLHVPSLRRFARGTPIVVPRGGERLLRGVSKEQVHPAGAGDVLDLADVRVTVWPATHDDRRGPYTRITAPAIGFRVDDGDRSFWFPGDTELRADMSEVGPVDLALVPIGGWGPTLEDGHMDPADAAEAVRRVGASTAVPVHWGTFWPIGLRHVARANHHRLFTTPGRRFAEALAGDDVQVLLVPPGTRVEIEPRGFTRMG